MRYRWTTYVPDRRAEREKTMRLIDAEKLEELLKEIKPIDFVPWIRCKDCKYLFKVKNGVFVTYGCERNWLCYAERKEK